MLWVRGHRISHAFARAVYLAVPCAPALPPGTTAVPYWRPGSMVGERHTHYSAHCSWDILLPGRGAGRLSLAGWLDRLLAGRARLDCRHPAVSPLRCRQHAPRLDGGLAVRRGFTCAAL